MRMRRSYTVFAASAFLLGAGLSHAASHADCDSDDGVRFTSQTDVDAANCTTVLGDVIIPATAVGNITFNIGLNTIKGDLVVEGCSDAGCSTVIGVSSTNLTEIGGRFQASATSSLQSVTFPELRSVGGALELRDLPALRQLKLEGINSVGSFHLVGAQNLRVATIGRYQINTDSNVGLKNITDTKSRVVEVREVGLQSLNGLMDFWNAELLVIENLPNLQRQVIRVGNVSEVRIVGNGNMTVYFWQTGLQGTPGPYIEKLVVSGVKHISPCLTPNVNEFVAVNNTVEYLHFNFAELRRFEVRENPKLKKMVPWPRLNRFWEDILIRDNPLLSLTQFPERAPDDNLTAYDCPSLYNSVMDEWSWFPNTFNTVVIAAAIDNTFFNETFTGIYLNASEKSSIKPRVLHHFEVNSTNSSFSCSDLDTLRASKGAFPGTYSCQGRSVPAGIAASGFQVQIWTVLGTATLVTMFVS